MRTACSSLHPATSTAVASEGMVFLSEANSPETYPWCGGTIVSNIQDQAVHHIPFVDSIHGAAINFSHLADAIVELTRSKAISIMEVVLA